MISNFIKIRFLQINRELKGISPVSFIVCAAVLFVMGAGLFEALVKATYIHYITAAIAIIVLYLQINRKDKRFIANTLTHPATLYFIEYILFSIPVLLLFLISGNWLYACFLLCAYSLISGINYNFYKKSTRLNLVQFIDSFNFEWVAGFRKSSVMLVVIYIAALALCFVNILSLLLLWLLTVIVAGFYEECEPLEVLCSPELSAAAFLNKKLEVHLKLYLLLIAPVILLYCILNPSSVIFAVCFVLGSSINIAYFIVSKYMLYHPQAKLRANAFNYGLVLMSIIMVFLLPVPLIMLFRNYKRAVANLNNYMHDYH